MSRKPIKSKLKSIDFSTLPYSFQNRLIDLTPPKTLFNLRQTGHSIHNITSRRGYFARIVTITSWNQLARQKHITFLENSKFNGARSLSLIEALKFKHIYVQTHLVVSLTPQQGQTLKPLLVPTYVNIIFMRGFTISDVTKFFHPNLIGFQLSDPNILATRQAKDQFIQTVLQFTTRGPVVKTFTNVISPQFYLELKAIVESERPSYRIMWKRGIVTVKHKRLMKIEV